MSTLTKPPAYQWYVNEWRGSRTVQRMTYAQRGMYREMLDEQWDAGSLPDDPKAVAELLGGSVEEWTENWPALRRKFVDRRARPRPGDPVAIPTDHDALRRIINLRLEKQRKERRAFIEGKQKAGRAGGHAKARQLQGIQASKTLAVPDSAVAKAGRGLAKSSSSSSSSSSTSSVDLNTTSEPKAARSLEGFETFWNVYPKRKARAQAEKAWRKIAPSPELVGRIVAAVTAQRQSFDWCKDGGQFVPYPATWLNAQRWEDEPGAVAPAAGRRVETREETDAYLANLRRDRDAARAEGGSWKFTDVANG